MFISCDERNIPAERDFKIELDKEQNSTLSAHLVTTSNERLRSAILARPYLVGGRCEMEWYYRCQRQWGLHGRVGCI